VIVNYGSTRLLIDFLWLFFIFPPSLTDLMTMELMGDLQQKQSDRSLMPSLHKVDSQVGFNLPEIDVSLSCSLSHYQ
jgi:hypothetical protein